MGVYVTAGAIPTCGPDKELSKDSDRLRGSATDGLQENTSVVSATTVVRISEEKPLRGETIYQGFRLKVWHVET
jgi:hypothetical protein